MTYKGYTIKTGYWIIGGRERYDAAIYLGGRLVTLTDDTYASRKEARQEARRMIDEGAVAADRPGAKR